MLSGDLLGAQASLLKSARALPKNKHPFRWLGEVPARGSGPRARVTGGLAMGRMDYNLYTGNNYGYASAHSYDKRGAVNPPPYFPTTGRFIESRYYEVDPVWLNGKGIANYFAELRAQ